MADPGARAARPGIRRRPAGPSAGAGSARCCAGTRCPRSRRRPAGGPTPRRSTEWSITSSTGTSGLTCAASPPRVSSASRMAARSTTPGTPVKSCMRTRSGVRAISAASSLPKPWRSGWVAPSGHRLDVGRSDRQPVLVAEQVLEHDLDRIGEPGHVEPVGQGVDPVDLVVGVADGEGGPCAEGVGGGRWGMTEPWPHSAPPGRHGEPGTGPALRSGCGSAGRPAGSGR